MNTELAKVFSQNPRYATAYAEFFESYKNGYGKNSTEEELAEFEKFFARDFQEFEVKIAFCDFRFVLF